MSDLSNDKREALAAFANKLKQQAAPVVEQPTSSVEASVVSDPTPEVPTQVDPAKVEPKEQPKQSQEEVEEVKTPEPEVIASTSWDDEPVETSVEPSPKFDFSKIGSVLNSEVKDESELISKVTELQTKVKEFETRGAATPIVPDDFKEVFDIAVKGGDWRSYISETQVDWAKEDPKALYERYVMSDPYFYKPDGTLDEEKYYSYMDQKTDYEKSFEGRKIIQQKLHEQQQSQQARLRQAEQARQAADRELAQATKQLSELLPVESFGIKFEQKHADQLYKGISDDSLLKKHFLNERGGYDMKKLAKTIALAEWGEKMVKFQAQKAATQAKKELLQSTQNVQLNSPSAPAEPKSERTQKDLTAVEKLSKYFASQRESGRL